MALTAVIDIPLPVLSPLVRCIEYEGIVTAPGKELVAARPTIERVIATPAEQNISTASTFEKIISFIAKY